MSDAIRRLPDGELELMLAVWQAGGPVSASAIREALGERRPWALPTLMTVLGRLTDKGFLICQKQGRHNLYRAAVSQGDYQAAQGRSLLETLYGNSFQSLVASLVDGHAVSQEDLRELRAYLDELEEKGGL